MIRTRYNIKVRGRDWGITVFFPLTCYHVEEVMRALAWVECERDDMRKAYINLTSGQLNNGLTFSNYELGESVIVFAKSANAGQYFNLVVHELHHLSVQIATEFGMDLEGEEVCYLNGDIAMMMYPVVSRLFCTPKRWGKKRGKDI